MKVKHNTKTAHYCNKQLSPTKDFGGAHKVARPPLNLSPPGGGLRQLRGQMVVQRAPKLHPQTHTPVSASLH